MKEACGQMIDLRLKCGRPLRLQFELLENLFQFELDPPDALFQLDGFRHFGRSVAYRRDAGKAARRQRARIVA
jgi:hypothetical protein